MQEKVWKDRSEGQGGVRNFRDIVLYMQSFTMYIYTSQLLHSSHGTTGDACGWEFLHFSISQCGLIIGANGKCIFLNSLPTPSHQSLSIHKLLVSSNISIALAPWIPAVNFTSTNFLFIFAYTLQYGPRVQRYGTKLARFPSFRDLGWRKFMNQNPGACPRKLHGSCHPRHPRGTAPWYNSIGSISWGHRPADGSGCSARVSRRPL